LSNTPSPAAVRTPYDGKVAVWYVHGRTVGETTIDQIARTLKEFAPAVNAVFVKVGEAWEWMGSIGSGDPKPDLAIKGPADIDRWVTKLAAYGLEFHAWAIPKGERPEADADFLIQAASRPGVRSLILDVEPYDGYYEGGRASVRPLMTRLRAGLPASFHIGLSVDPRPWHYDSIFPAEWRPFVNSVHPQIYWADFGKTPTEGFDLAYQKWKDYGLPIIPVLQGYQGSGDRLTRTTMDEARVLAAQTYKAPGVSWFRFGTLNRTLFPAVNVTMAGTVPRPDTGTPGGTPVPSGGKFGTEVIVKSGEAPYREGTYDNTPSPLIAFQNEENWTAKYVKTSASASNVWVRWDPRLPRGGFWEISAFVPTQHSHTMNARYKIHGIAGQTSDFEVRIAQEKLDGLWVSLGIFNFPPNTPIAGVVFLNDLTGETDKEIAFDAIRWREVTGIAQPPRYMADGFDSPVGTPDEREGIDAYPASWRNTNPYKNQYLLAGVQTIHTGDDLVMRRGKTLGQQLFAVASGVVVSARREGRAPNWGSWGNVITIRHDPLITTGQVVYSRYGHVDNMQVKVGDRVVRGQHIADIGDAYGYFRNVPHLHFDISPTRIFETSPGDWPGQDMRRIERDYIDPTQFIAQNRPLRR
jgi:murein DD-endopeptidase MepM/ murein hydrolase activator NlpD